MILRKCVLLTAVVLSFFQGANAFEIAGGKWDSGYIWSDIDVVNDGVSVNKIKMWGGSYNGTVVWDNGFMMKSAFAYAEGEGNYHGLNVAAGWYIPLGCNFSVGPYLGVGKSIFDLNADLPGFANAYQRYSSTTALAGIDGSWTYQRFMVSGSVQYALVDTKTTVTHPTPGFILETKTQSKGWNYMGQVDYFITDCTSINLGYVVNTSRSKEKRGLDVEGFRIGFGVKY